MPHRRLPNSNATRDTALSTCKDKMDGTAPTELPFSDNRANQLTATQPQYHSLIVAANTAKSNQTGQSAIVAPLHRIARLWVSHGYQAMINACTREEFANSVKNLYGLTLDAKGAPEMTSEAGILQAAIAYNDGEAARTAAGGAPITFPALADINTHVNAFKTELVTQSTLKDIYDAAQEELSASNTDTDLLILQLWNSIEANYDTGDKPSMRRKAREWGVVYVPSKGETPTGDDYSVVGRITDSVTLLPLPDVLVILQNAAVTESYITDDDGMFFLPPVASNQYDLRAELAGYMPFITPVMVVEGEVQEINVSLNSVMPPLPPEV